MRVKAFMAALVLAAVMTAPGAAQFAGTTDEQPEELAENDLIETALLKNAHQIQRCKITYYCPERCCNGSNAWRTASGTVMIPGVTVGVDPDVIPLGSDVMIDFGDGELHYYRAADTGVTGNRVDILVETHREALALGAREATVYWVEW